MGHDCIRNEKGIAMLMVLVISVIVLTVTATMLYMVSTGTGTSGRGKRYSSSLECAQAAKLAITDLIAKQGASSSLGAISNTSLLDDKIKKPIEEWPAGCDKSLVMDPLDSKTYDIKLELGDYICLGKIIGNTKGTSKGRDDWENRGVEDTGEGIGEAFPYLYAIETIGINTKNEEEVTRLSLLYEY